MLGIFTENIVVGNDIPTYKCSEFTITGFDKFGLDIELEDGSDMDDNKVSTIRVPASYVKNMVIRPIVF